MAEEPTTMAEDTGQEHVDYDDCKVFVSRIPTAFDEAAVKRLLQDKLSDEEAVVNVALIYPHEEGEGDEGDEKRDKEKPQQDKEKPHDKDKQQQDHRGFGYVTFDSHQRQQEALSLGTVRGGAKPTSTKKHTLYLAPIRRKNESQEENDDDEPGVCFLWQNRKCPYGNDCKFAHTGEGACLPPPKKEDEATRKKRKKCFNYKKNKCKLGDDCPFSHDFIPETKPMEPRDDSQKDCLTWKKKGKCNKGEACPYLHDVEVQKRALEKKKRKGSNNSQPLSVRVFGLNYDTSQQDVREYFQHCGPIMELTFPTFEDSGRSKGYCGILFQSPKAVAKAVELDGKELHGRWLRVQAGKMYLRQWEEQHEARKRTIHEPQVGEFGQKVKKRKQHGFKEEDR